jgi:hypothetical protein
VILPFEENLLRGHGIDATFVGHPLLDRATSLPDRKAARATLGLSDSSPVLALFPGSRQQEIERHIDDFVDTAREVAKEIPDLQVIVSAASTVSLDLAAGTGNFFRLKEKLDPSKPPQQQVSILDFVDYIPLSAPEGEPLRLEFDAFVAAIHGEAPVIVSGEDGRRALAVALRIVQEIERTRPALEGIAAPSGA